MLSALDRSPNKVNETFNGSGEEEKTSNEASIHLWGYSPDFASNKVSMPREQGVSSFNVDQVMEGSSQKELVEKVKRALKKGTIDVAEAASIVQAALDDQVNNSDEAHFSVF